MGRYTNVRWWLRSKDNYSWCSYIIYNFYGHKITTRTFVMSENFPLYAVQQQWHYIV